MPDEQRLFPLLTDEGRRLLRWLREHEHAPHYTHLGCDRLTGPGLERVRAFEATVNARLGWPVGQLPVWLPEFADRCYRDVPFYRRYGSAPDDFSAVPTCSRADLSREPWAFVPDAQPLDDLVIYQTSGATGHPLDILTHPEPLAMYVPLIRAALGTHGITLDGVAGQVAIVLVCFQKRTWTYASIMPAFNQAGLVKVNLNPDDWRAPSDRARFLEACRPEIYTGDPISFTELAALPLTTRPKALVSTAMALLPGLRAQLETHFGCPVIDVYSTNETGPMAVATNTGHVLLQPRLYVEILDDEGTPCLPGVRGQVTVSGGMNPFLPLLRYRTGDWASLAFQDDGPVLTGLEGRTPVVFCGTQGQRINNIDVSTMLKPFALAQYALHQSQDGSLRLRVRGAVAEPEKLRGAILALFGADQVLTIEELAPDTGAKLIQYTRDA